MKASAIEQSVIAKDLAPLLEMLDDKSGQLSSVDSITLFKSTRDRILNSPEQYLSGQLKPSEELTNIVNRVFGDRLVEQFEVIED